MVKIVLFGDINDDVKYFFSFFVKAKAFTKCNRELESRGCFGMIFLDFSFLCMHTIPHKTHTF